MKTKKLLPLLMLLALAACGEKAANTEPAESSLAPASETAMVAPEAPAAPAAAEVAEAPASEAAAAPAVSAETLAIGEKVYGTSCVACHGAGVLGAPKTGDKAAWAAHLAKGSDTLHTNAIKGINMMPPKGGNAALSDEEVKAAVDYMISQAG